jgi:hypothetical protein
VTIRARADGSLGADLMSRSLSFRNFSQTSSGMEGSPPEPDPDLGSSDDLSATGANAFL